MTRKKRVLSIAYDDALMRTRQYILEGAGFEVLSALGFADASQIATTADYDALLLGYTLPPNDKTALIKLAHEKCKCPVVSIYRHGYEPHPLADFAVDSGEGPESFLAAVKKALGSTESKSRE